MEYDITYRQAKKKAELSLRNGDEPEVLKWLTVMQKKAVGDVNKEGEVAMIVAAIMEEDQEALEELMLT